MRCHTSVAIMVVATAAMAQEPDEEPIPAEEEPLDAPLPQAPPPVDPEAPEAPDAAVPVPAWMPAGKGFEARIQELADHIKKHNPTNDHRVFNRIVFVTARTGTRVWLERKAWNDGKVRFAVGRESAVIEPFAAIKAAEAKANAALEGTDTASSRRLLDWFIDEDGVAYALVARWLTLEERGEAPSP